MADVTRLFLHEILTLAITSKDDPKSESGEFFPDYNSLIHGDFVYLVPQEAKNIYMYEIAVLKEIEKFSTMALDIPEDTEENINKLNDIDDTIINLMLKHFALKMNRNSLISEALLRENPDVWESLCMNDEEETPAVGIDFQIHNGWLFTIVEDTNNQYYLEELSGNSGGMTYNS